ncbi:hypothetical protein SAMN05421548_1395 [Paraburkholderia lycopersici]|uniref:Uncharacterized protein n=1 Tax=Paraburkholderia lycopersici TaxID=416944 RepID=A0A1G7BF42_9BURK|nr:hypothetical protein SAMN05421548_1395 [Paraburkholderia lycopersici]
MVAGPRDSARPGDASSRADPTNQVGYRWPETIWARDRQRGTRGKDAPDGRQGLVSHRARAFPPRQVKSWNPDTQLPANGGKIGLAGWRQHSL